MCFMRKALLVSGLISGLFVPVWTAPAAARSPDDPARDLSLTYRIYYGGFEVLHLSVDIHMAPEKYAIEMEFRTQGMIGALFPWTMKAYSRGRLDKNAVLPVVAGHRNSWRGRQRWVELRYKDGRPVVTDAHPVPKGDKPSPESLLDTIDLGSAILAMTRKFDRNQDCGLRLPVFDGRRRYDLLFKELGNGAIRRNGYSAYAGPVVKCRVEMDRLAGFKTRHKSYGGWGEADRAAVAFMGSPFIEGPPVPVRIEIQTRWGDVIAHLARAKLAANGTTREIARRN